MFTRNPLVSIVTPSYNQGRYIEETIQSVLRQDYPHVEYIVVDGGSSDSTVEILKKYEGRLVWLSERDRGQADAINKGFRLARGEILGWLNSDDTYLPGAIHQAVRYLQEHPEVGMVYGEGYHIDEHGYILERYYTEPFDYMRLGEICFICQPTVFMRAAVFKAVGPLDIDLHYSLDYEYWMRIAKRFRIGYLNAYLANSRLHMDTKTLSKRVEVHQEILQTVRRHYGRVPTRWISAYAHVYLTQKLMPYLQGIYGDGWAGQHVRVVLGSHWRSFPYLCLQGVCPEPAIPLSLRLAVGQRLLRKAVIEEREFALRERIWPWDEPPENPQALEIEVYAENAYTPHALGVSNDTRTLSYGIRKLSLVDELGRELRLYSGRLPRLFAVALPILSLWESLVINHGVSREELRTYTRRCWHGIRAALFGAGLGGR